ncbi:Transposase IS4 [Popillia japonica]|uniref:Transposase IS4 n=1 Tax=Popillia japonica TaxID=7064 RepID=A0AAW1I9R5_POPJA
MDIRYEPSFCLQEAIEMIYADNDLDVEAIYTEPPEVNQLTDEDSGDEDDSGDLVKLSGRQLCAPVEALHQNYALFKNSADPHITSEEIKRAIGGFILSGYDIKPARRFYWEFKSDLGNPMVKNAIRKNRFEQIMQFVHLADNNNPLQNDRAWKIHPLMDKLKHAFLKYFVPEENINYDESMGKNPNPRCVNSDEQLHGVWLLAIGMLRELPESKKKLP